MIYKHIQRKKKAQLRMLNVYIDNNLNVHIYCTFKNTIIKEFEVNPKSEGICLESSLRKGMA